MCFSTENINCIQVTVQRSSFTVICTYFFAEGHIYVILNKLAKLSTKDYNAEGTASMVIKTLCETLGFTKSKLTNVLKHFVYDGGRLGGKFIICMKSLITIFRLMVCLWFPFHSASLKHTRKKAM